jgi:TonB-like protein
MRFRNFVYSVCFIPLHAFSADKPAQIPPQQSQQPHEYMRGEVTVPCPDDEKENCVYHRLIVDNQSSDWLECFGRMTYDGVNREKLSTAERKFVVVPHGRKVVVGDATTPDVNVTAHTMQCSARKPLDASKLTPQCTRVFSHSPKEIDYPPASRRASEEGPVLLDFSLTDHDDHPTDIVVVGSSLSQRLDEAAIAFVAKYIGSTDCKQGRFRTQVTFQLK